MHKQYMHYAGFLFLAVFCVAGPEPLRALNMQNATLGQVQEELAEIDRRTVEAKAALKVLVPETKSLSDLYKIYGQHIYGGLDPEVEAIVAAQQNFIVNSSNLLGDTPDKIVGRQLSEACDGELQSLISKVNLLIDRENELLREEGISRPDRPTGTTGAEEFTGAPAAMTPQEMQAAVFERLGFDPQKAALDSSRYNRASDGTPTYPKSRRKMRMEEDLRAGMLREQAFEAALAAGPEETQRFLARESQNKAQQALQSMQMEQMQMQQQMRQIQLEAQSIRNQREWDAQQMSHERFMIGH
jgi:hypothetical protein